MAFSSTGDGLNDDLLFKLFKEHVKNELKKAISPMVTQIVDDCVDEAVKGMTATLYSHYNMDGLGKTIKIILEKK